MSGLEADVAALQQWRIEVDERLRIMRLQQTADAEKLDRILAILDTITRIRNFFAWLAPVLGVIGYIAGRFGT